MSKAGSSAIQRALVDNTAVLARIGICFPRAGRRGLAHYLIKSDICTKRSTDHLRRALDEAASSDVAVLSCEGFWLMEDSEIERLKEGLAGHATQVVLYLRRPADYLRSSYRQGIKQKGRTRTCAAYLAGVQARDRMNYPRLLERWARQFQLRVRTYEAVKQTIEEDFMRAIGASLEQVDARRRIVNPTPSDGDLRLMLLANRYLPSRVSKQVRRLIRGSERSFDFIPPVDDEALRQYGKEVVQQWDLDVLRQYLSEDDVNLLIA